MSNVDRASIEACARAGHEVNRAFCIAQGDLSEKPWDEAPERLKESRRAGVVHVLSGASAEQAHENWRAERLAQGWTWGATKNNERKEHPALMPYGDLPTEQKAKNELFAAVVAAMSSVLWRIPNQ